MDSDRIKSTLELIGKVYGKILDESHKLVIPEAQMQVDLTKKEYDWAMRNHERDKHIVPKPWGYQIHHSQPLSFKAVKLSNGLELRVDMYGEVLWASGDQPTTQDIKVRVWSEHEDVIYDENRDAQCILQQLTDESRAVEGRVVSRFHFDKANEGQTRGPQYHMQIGGIPQDYELCWHPKKVNVPRFEYHPMELFLTCQMVAINFFESEYDNIKQRYRNEIVFHQNLFLREYFESCLKAIQNKEILIDSLWVR